MTRACQICIAYHFKVMKVLVIFENPVNASKINPLASKKMSKM